MNNAVDSNQLLHQKFIKINWLQGKIASQNLFIHAFKKSVFLSVYKKIMSMCLWRSNNLKEGQIQVNF